MGRRQFLLASPRNRRSLLVKETLNLADTILNHVSHRHNRRRFRAAMIPYRMHGCASGSPALCSMTRIAWRHVEPKTSCVFKCFRQRSRVT